MKISKIILLGFGLLLLISPLSRVYAGCGLKGECAEGEYVSNDPFTDCGYSSTVGLKCCCSGSGVEVCLDTDENGNCIAPAHSSWLEEVFGSSLNLDIFRSSNYWEGETGLFVILAVFLGNGFVVLFIAVLFAIGIGVVKYLSSQGEQAKLDSAQKWLKNALIGFAVVVVSFVGVNVVTYMLGVGNVFSLAENLAVCNNTALIEWKRENNKLDGINCKCEAGGWTCESET